jgi:hypothetical protein
MLVVTLANVRIHAHRQLFQGCPAAALSLDTGL